MAKMNYGRSNKEKYIQQHGSVSAYDGLPLPRSLQKTESKDLTPAAATLLSRFRRLSSKQRVAKASQFHVKLERVSADHSAIWTKHFAPLIKSKTSGAK